MTQVKFLRARVEPDPRFPEHGTEVSFDTESAAIAMFAMAESGWLTCCAACGTEANVQKTGIVTTDQERKYVYRLCASCEGAWADESGSIDPPVVHGRPVGTLFSTRIHTGRIGRRVNEALVQFMADGEPEPEGWRGPS